MKKDQSKTVKLDGDTWEVVSYGATRDGKTYCHLKSKTRGKWQKNGFYPAQMCDWIDNEILQSA